MSVNNLTTSQMKTKKQSCNSENIHLFMAWATSYVYVLKYVLECIIHAGKATLIISYHLSLSL